MRVFLLICVSILSGCTYSVTSAGPSEPISASYTASGGAFASGGTVILLLAAREYQGFTAVCGVRTNTRLSASAAGYLYEILGTGIIRLGDQTIFQGVQRFPQRPLTSDMTGTPARCLQTDLPWQPAFQDAQTVVHFPRRQFVDIFDGPQDRFRQTDVPGLGTGGAS